MIGGVILLIFAWLFFPWNAQVTALAVLRAYGETIFYATTPAVIKAVHARAGLSVRQGDVLYELTSPKLENEARKLTADLAAADWRINFLRVNRETAAEAPLAERERAEIAKRLTEVKRQLAALTVTSPFDGVILETEPVLAPGEWVRASEKLASAAPVRKDGSASGLMPEVWGFMAESNLLRVAQGSSAVFVPEDAGRSTVRQRTSSVDRAATRQIGAAPELASTFGGPPAASVTSDAAARSLGGDAGRAYALKDAVYRVRLTGKEVLSLTKTASGDYDTAGTEVIRGHVVIDGERESLAGRWLRCAWAVLMRESGF